MILITNDDGILAPGLAALHKELVKLDQCVVVAPDAERSAAGHAITMANPLRAVKVKRGGLFFGYACSGTPADCVKMAFSARLVHQPRLVVSGINLGANVGTNILYSGTVSAATEAAMLGFPAMAVSLNTFKDPDFRTAAVWARRLAVQILDRGLPKNMLLNVNVPALSAARIKGVRVTRQGVFRFEDRLVKRMDPHGREYYWLAASKGIFSQSPDCDDRAVRQGYVSVTPVDFDMTANHFLEELKSWKIE
jgi:5'-nucleotidase